VVLRLAVGTAFAAEPVGGADAGLAGFFAFLPRPERYIRYIRYIFVFIISFVALVALVAASQGREVAVPSVVKVLGDIALAVELAYPDGRAEAD
jgi:hypothetical protein